MSTWFNYAATLKILVFSLLVGAGLPVLFAVGVRVGAAGAGGTAGSHAVAVKRPILTVLSWVIFALVLAAVAVGVLFIAREFIAHHTGWFILDAPRPHNAK